MKRARPYDRETALAAAETLFWTKGYHATSLKDLEAALQMKPGSIYAAFSSKEALFCLALDRYFARMSEEFRNEIDQAESPLTALSEYLRKLGRYPASDPRHRACMLVKTVLDATPEETAIAAHAGRYLDQIREEFTRMFERAKAMGELPADADCARLARRYQTSITAIKIEMHRGAAQADLVALAEDMAMELDALNPARSAA